MECSPAISSEIQDLVKQHRSLQIIDNGEKVQIFEVTSGTNVGLSISK